MLEVGDSLSEHEHLLEDLTVSDRVAVLEQIRERNLAVDLPRLTAVLHEHEQASHMFALRQ